MIKSSTKNNLLAILACLLWSTAFATVKITLRHMSPLVLAGIRFLLAGILLVPFCGGIAKLKDTVTTHIKTVLIVSLFQSILLYGSFFIAMQYVGGAIAAIVIGSSPLISALIAHILMKDDKLTRRNSIAIAFGTAGIIVIALNSKPWEPVGLIEFAGILTLLVGSVVSAIGNVKVATKKKTIHPVALNCAQIFIGGMVLLAIGIIKEGIPSFALPPLFYLALIWLAALSAIAFSIWFYLLERVKVSKLNIWKFILPVFGAIISWLVLDDESPTIWAVLGLICIVTGIVTAYSKKKQV